MGKGAPFTPPEMLAGDGTFQYDERNKRIVSPQGQYIGGSQVTDILNQMTKNGQLLLDIHQAIEVILFGRTPDGGDIAEAPADNRGPGPVKPETA